MGKAADFWNEHYTRHTDDTKPSEFLLQMIPRMAKGKCLEIGMGTGRNAVELAKHFELTGIDISSVAVKHAEQRAQTSEVQFSAKQTDLDLFIFGLMEYDSLVAIDFRPPLTRYYSEFIRSLKQGGTLLVDSLLIDDQPEAYSEDESFKNYYYHHNELLKHLKGMRILYYHEGLVDSQNRVQLLAKKPMDRDAAKYGFFDIQSAKSEDPAKDKQRELAERLFKKN